MKNNCKLKWCIALFVMSILNGIAQQRSWMIPYYQNNGAITSTGGVENVPIINFRTGTPVYETKYIGGSFSTQAVGNGEYCNNCATDQVTKISQFFISGRAADEYQTNTDAPNKLRALYAKWDQICGDTARNDLFETNNVEIGHESLNEVAIGDGETPGTFWVVMQQSPINDDGFGPGAYVYLMDMNNGTLNANINMSITNSTYTVIPSGNVIGEGVALGPKFNYIMQAGETNPSLINLNGRNCRSIYIASGSTIYHFLIDLSNNTLTFSDSYVLVSGGAQMFMEIDMNFPQGNDHPTALGLTGWGGVYMVSLSPDNGKIVPSSNVTISTSTGGYGLEFEPTGTYMYYSLQGASAPPVLKKYNIATLSSTTLTIGTLSGAATYNNMCLESAIDGNIYGLTTNQELISIIDPELASTTSATFVNLSAGSFHNPVTGAADLAVGTNTANFRFGLSLPDWVDGEVPLSSEGGSIVVKLPCALCDDAKVKHDVDIYATNNGTSTLLQHFDMFPCEEISLSVCPGIIYDVVFDEGLPTEQHTLEQIAFAGDVHNVTFNIANASLNYIAFNTNTTITTNTLWDNKVYIGDNVIVTVAAGVTLDITNVDVVFGSDAGIDFINGSVLRANNSVFRPCQINNVWRGLAFFETNGVMPSGLINECTFKNAKTAIEALGSTSPLLKTIDLRITNNLFADCNRGIGLNLVDFKRSITGNTYMIENKFLPFSTINSSSINPPKTTAPSLNQNDFYGLFSMTTSFKDIISQNDFIMTSDSTNGDQMSYAIYLYNLTNPTNLSTPSINSNKITDFSYGISTYGINKLSIENNELEWTNLYKKVIAAQYKFHIYVTNGSNILIKNNKIYSANFLNTVAGANTLDGGTGGPSTPTYKSVGITANNCIGVSIKQNEIVGVESGIVAIGLNPTASIAKNIYIAENEIKKSWYYGIYLRSYENTDVSCNVIDMELKTGRDATGIGYFNLPVSNGTYVKPVNFALRGNCVFNTKNGIYCYNPTAAGVTNMPKVYNNFVYNFTRVGFENNGFTKIATSTPYELNRNTFVSNNSTSGLPDLITDATHPLTGDFNFGIQNISGAFTLLNGSNGNSTAACGSQITTNSNTLNATQICDYYYPTQSSWNPAGKVIDWNNEDVEIHSENQTFELSDPLYVSIDAIESVTQQQFDVFPTPALSNVSINYNIETNDNAHIDFIDVQGRIVKTVILTANYSTIDINIAELNTGVYILRMVNEGKSSSYAKMIKQ